VVYDLKGPKYGPGYDQGWPKAVTEYGPGYMPDEGIARLESTEREGTGQ
jgi:hypothetical protein